MTILIITQVVANQCEYTCESVENSPICAEYTVDDNNNKESKTFANNCEFDYGKCIGTISTKWEKTSSGECAN